MQAATASLLEQVWTISDIAEKYGHVGYAFQAYGLERIIEICGLQVVFHGPQIVRVAASDLQAEMIWQAPANSNVVEISLGLSVMFRVGNADALAAWARQLEMFAGKQKVA